jgi:AcrR family transcriptional regulator
MTTRTPQAQPQISAGTAGVTRPWRGVSAADRVAERRRRLLDAGLELFGTNGVAAVSVAEVCAEAGLTKRYFYEGFQSIDALADAVVDDAVDRLSALVVPILLERGILDPRPAAFALAEAVLSDPRLVRLLVVETNSGTLVRHRERLIERAVETWLATIYPSAGEEAKVRLRFFAYAGFGALGELATAWIDGRLEVSLSRLVDWMFDLYARLVPAVVDAAAESDSEPPAPAHP